MNKFLLCALFSFFTIGYAQDSEGHSRLEKLETDFAIIKDFLNVELKNVNKKLKRKNRSLDKLEKDNKKLSKKVENLERLVKDLESQVLSLQIKKSTVHKKVEPNSDVVEEVKPKKIFKNKKLRKIAKNLQSSNEDLRIAAVIKLNNIDSSKESIDLYKKAFQDQSPYVKIVACKGAKKQGHNIAVFLIELLSDANMSVRKHANSTLEKITQTTVNFDPKRPQEEKIREWEKKVKDEKLK